LGRCIKAAPRRRPNTEALLLFGLPSLGFPGPIPRTGPILKRHKRLSSHPPPLPGGGLPVCTGPSSEIRIGKAESRKREKRERKKIGGECFLSRAVGSLGRFQAQAVVSISLMLEQPERLRWREVRLPQNCGKKGLSKSVAENLLFIATIRAIDKRGERGRLFP